MSTALVTRAELVRYGVRDEFIAQFDVLAIEVAIAAGGALGVATVKWRRLGASDSEWSGEFASSPRAPWSWSPSGAFATMTFAAGTYYDGMRYTIDESGAVASADGGSGLTATRYDVVADKIIAVTEEVITRMRPRAQLALASWPAIVKEGVSKIVRYELKDYVGFAPSDTSIGDLQIKDEAQRWRDIFDSIGRGDWTPPDLIDTSGSNLARPLQEPITADDAVGWNC